MKERAFNLFAFVTGDYVLELGAVVHCLDGPDEEQVQYLRAKVTTDAPRARRFAVPSRYRKLETNGAITAGIHYRVFQQMTNGGRLCEVFHEVLEELNASPEPILVLTHVVDGVVRIDGVINLPTTAAELRSIEVNRYPAPDYAVAYLTDEGFDLARLLNDDYLRAIKLLYRERFYVSAAKLLMSFVDTIAYLDEGDKTGNFQRWLNSYVALSAIGLTADEVWEFRNSILHMTNVDSRKVVAGKVRRILFFVGTMPSGFATSDGNTKFFSLYDLILGLTDGLAKWGDGFNQIPTRWAEFFQRYDRILSDTRYEVISHTPVREPEFESKLYAVSTGRGYSFAALTATCTSLVAAVSANRKQPDPPRAVA